MANWEIILFVIMMALFSITGIAIAIYFYGKRQWPWKVTVMRDVPPFGTIPYANDRAKVIAFGDGGEEIFFLKKMKKYKVGYGKTIGDKKICWTISQDGYWYNTTFGNLDKKLKQIGIIPVERDLRLAHSSMRKGIENRYNDKTFYERWAVPITIGMLIFAMIVAGVGMWYSNSKQLQIAQVNAEATKTSLEVTKLNKEVLELLKGGTAPSQQGFIPAVPQV